VVAGLTLWRLVLIFKARPLASAAGLVLVILVLISGGAWLAAGPLAAGWASRAGAELRQPAPPAQAHSHPAAAQQDAA
jgi:hypothetical protein